MTVVRMAQRNQGNRSAGENRIAVSDFKTHCLRLLDRVRSTREEITVTRYGKPIARVVPYDREEEPYVGSLRGGVTGYEDLVSPVDEDWEADG